jgi:tetratricopeptide (TPR) repeat protein
MKTLVSGQAGKAIILQGDEASIFDVFNPEEELVRPSNTIHFYFAGTGDVEKLDLNTKQEVKEVLNFYWERSLSLQLFLIFLDSEEETETRLIAGEDLSPYLENSEIIEYISNILYSSPFPKNFELNFENISIEKFPALHSFIKNLNHSQEAIDVVRKNWDYLPLDIFNGDVLRKQEFEKQAITNGIFKNFARAYSDPTKYGMAWLDSQLKLGKLKNSRQVLQAWTENFKADTSEVNIDIAIDERDQDFLPLKENFEKKNYYNLEEIIGSIDKQKDAITDCLKKGNLNRARKYVDDLIKYQLRRGGPAYLAKSLCHLSKLAKDMCNYSMQLEWAQRAFDFDPDDGRVHCHIADAYICLYNYDEAIKWLKSGVVFGESSFQLNGYARIFKGQGNYEKALQAYSETCEKFPESVFGWIGKAEVLRDMWKLEEALDAYEEAIDIFPDEKIPKCGKGRVLKDLGELEEAEGIFDNLIEKYGDEFSYAGKAEVLREKDEFNEALDIYSQAIEEHPNSPVLHNGFASVLKDNRDFKKALKYYNEIISQFPFDSGSWSGKAEVLREMGKLNEARDIYLEGEKKFPDSSRMISGKANIFKRLGLFDQSLQYYDQGALKFPYDIYLLCGHADLLKELGLLEEAIKAYEKVEQLSPRLKSVPHAKAAIFVAMKKFEKAEELISIQEPKTRDDWIAFHIKCMILLKTNNYEDAKDKLEFGLKFNPFADQKKYFLNSLSAINLFEGNLDETRNYICEDQTPLTNIIRMHYFCEARQFNEAKKAYSSVKDRCTPILSSLRDELGARYNILPIKAKYSKQWIFEQECKNILLKAS